MEAAKRPAENGSNGDSTDAKKAKLDPDCGALLFCGTTEWKNVRNKPCLIYIDKVGRHSETFCFISTVFILNLDSYFEGIELLL